MAESKKRKKNGKEASEDTEIQAWTDGIPLSPRWWAPTFVTLLIVGLLWLMVYYISQEAFPIPGIRWWNLVIGLGIMMVGFLMTLRWR
ncbi:cell division protein CrgA [Schaalia sp. ZJ405]|uniref:cell division protein CrgA n=1 Tax=unclassified Schaalia TaxID=2691889 RepID=UPI0013EB24BC|nr:MULTISPECIES: cell division protein CrgA [unclassified Schaalia]QPK81428.1 cell division protein CrgA [Schaalia sp. ZJ405]